MFNYFPFGFLLAALTLSCQKKAESVEAPPTVPSSSTVEKSAPADSSSTKKIDDSLKNRALALLEFASNTDHSTQTAILIDLSRHSGENRFFVWDFQSNKPVHQSLVAHGHCRSEKDPEEVVFSNVVDSNCSSRGKYSIGARYMGKYGLSYKLHGLDESNSAAFERFIVMHGHECVPDRPQSDPICYSEGCPTLSPSMINTVMTVIDNSDKPILMWIFK